MSDRSEIIEVLARYVRALEERAGEKVAELFATDGVFELFSRRGRGEYVAAGLNIVGREGIHRMVESGSMSARQGMHYLTTDHIVEITGEQANMQAQFLAVESNAELESEVGWTIGANIVQGTLAVTMIGRYESRFRKIEGRWLLTAHHVMHNLPLSLSAKT